MIQIRRRKKKEKGLTRKVFIKYKYIDKANEEFDQE